MNQPATSPLITAVIPAYNRKKWLRLSVGSAIRQTHRNLEILVVDDGSTDDSAGVMNELMREDPRVRYLRNVHAKGVSGARNTGIDAARGEFVAFLDSDDEWKPQHIERSLEVFHRSAVKIDVVSGCAERRRWHTKELFCPVRQDYDGVAHQPLELGVLLDCTSLFDRYIYRGGLLETPALVLSRSALKTLRFPEDLRMGEDTYFKMELALRELNIAYLPEVVVTCWSHDENSTTAGERSVETEKLLQIYEDFERLGEKMLTSFPLSSKQAKHVRRMMASGRFWLIGYRGHLLEGRFVQARKSFRMALSWQPTNLTYWRIFLLSYLRQLWRSSRSAAPTRS